MQLLPEERAYNDLIDELLKALEGVVLAHEPGSQIVFVKPLLHERTDAAGVRWETRGMRHYYTTSGGGTIPLSFDGQHPLVMKIGDKDGDPHCS